MIVLKLGFAVAGLALLHETIAAHGTAMSAHIITASAAVLGAVIVGLTKESFI